MIPRMQPAELPERSVRPGRYRHFKGAEYDVLNVGRHTETDELMVVYYAVREPKRVWVRPLEMFNEVVEVPTGTRRRFEPADQPAEHRLRRFSWPSVGEILRRSRRASARGLS